MCDIFHILDLNNEKIISAIENDGGDADSQYRVFRELFRFGIQSELISLSAKTYKQGASAYAKK